MTDVYTDTYTYIGGIKTCPDVCLKHGISHKWNFKPNASLSYDGWIYSINWIDQRYETNQKFRRIVNLCISQGIICNRMHLMRELLCNADVCHGTYESHLENLLEKNRPYDDV